MRGIILVVFCFLFGLDKPRVMSASMHAACRMAIGGNNYANIQWQLTREILGNPEPVMHRYFRRS